MTNENGFTFEIKQDYEREVETAKSQATFILEIADKIKSDQKLNALERDFCIAVLKGTAKHLQNHKPKKPRGHQPKLVPSDVCLIYHSQILQGSSKNKAYEYVAELFECSTEAIKPHIKLDEENGSPTIKFLESCELITPKPVKKS